MPQSFDPFLGNDDFGCTGGTFRRIQDLEIRKRTMGVADYLIDMG